MSSIRPLTLALLLAALTASGCGDGETTAVDGGTAVAACPDPKPLPQSFPPGLPVHQNSCVIGVYEPNQPGYLPWRVEADIHGTDFAGAAAFFEQAFPQSGLEYVIQADARDAATPFVNWCFRGPGVEGTVVVREQIAYRGAEVGVVYTYPEACAGG